MMVLIRSYILEIPRQNTPRNDMKTDPGHVFFEGFLQRESNLSSSDDLFFFDIQ